MQQSNNRLIQKHMLSYATITTLGIVALLVGLILIIIMRYHERAYVFLGLGTSCFIGGIAGIVGTNTNFKTVLSYGMIALGMMGVPIGINYIVNRYGPSPSPTHAALVLSVSIAVLLIGFLGAWFVERERGTARLSKVLTLGITASIGIVALIVGAVYKYVLNSPTHAYMLFGAGIVCLIIGIIGGIFSRTTAMRNR